MQEVLRVSSHVTDLSLRDNRIDDEHLAMLVESMRDGSCGIRRLDVAHNRLTERAVRALLPHCCCADAARASRPAAAPSSAAAWPPQSLRVHPGPLTLLTHLDLSGNPIGDAGTRRLCQEMCKGGLACEMAALVLEDCGLTHRCAPALEEMLLTTRSLQRLSLAWNSFGTRGARALAAGVESNISVAVLRLAWAGLGDTGTSHVVAALNANATLREVDLGGNNASYSTCVVAAEMLDRNASLRVLALPVNPLTQQGIQALLRAIIKHADRALAVELQLASFAKVDASLLPVVLDPCNPDGTYCLDLGRPVHRQTAVDLIRCDSAVLGGISGKALANVF